MNAIDNSSIHRHLDAAFAGIELTPEIQDLKEEIRGNLAARVDELTGGGMELSAAATKAVDELGDIRELVAQIDEGEPRRSTGSSNADAYVLHRVRPRPAFVVGIVIASLATVVELLLAALGATGVLPLPIGAIIALAGVASAGIAWVVGDSLAHETTVHHPMPRKRAAGYFLASLLGTYGLAIGGLFALGAVPAWVVAIAALGVVAAIVLFAFLGATQTNRTKTWVRAAARDQSFEDRFSQDPVAAARFGMYTVVIWLLAFAAFAVLSTTAGFAWSWLALLAGFAVFFLTLARMLFPPDRKEGHKER
ncbi:permease prefix domain 1-containing protein [Parafrigoribacterium soli]|uniref:permease prefix domain 1-containing protein n=1 Tax=Parafrigoribacterium soli TaxID=3144663 RepID=UPI0032F041AF